MQEKYTTNKLKCCEFKGKQASKIESTSLCCRSYSVLHVIDQKNEWSVLQNRRSLVTVMPNTLRDWSLITGRGATKWENCGSKTFCAPPPPQNRVKLCVPPFKRRKLVVLPPIAMAKTLSSHIKTTSKLVVPHLQHG